MDDYKYSIRKLDEEYVLIQVKQDGKEIIHCRASKDDCAEMYKKNFERPYSRLTYG